MSISIIARTPLSDLSLTEWRGQPAIQNYTTLLHLLEAERTIPLTFAEPVAQWTTGDQPGQITWYAPADTSLHPVTTLPAAEQDSLLTSLAETLTKLRATATAHGQNYSSFLEKALFIPDMSAILTDGTRIVLAPWGTQHTQHRTDTSAPGAFAASPLGTLLIPPPNPPDLRSAQPQKQESGPDQPPAAKLDPFLNVTPPNSFEAPPNTTQQTASLPFHAAPTPSPRPLPKPLRILLHGLVFILFFSLTVWAALRFASHTRAISLFGHTFFGTSS